MALHSWTELRARTWEVLEASDEGDELSRAVDLIILSLVFGNVLVVILESVSSIGRAYHDLFIGFERVSVAAFSAEFLARTWSSAGDQSATGSALRKRLRYLFSPMAIIDIIAIAPFYLQTLFAVDLRFLRVLRLLRIVKLTRYFPALGRILEVYHLQRSALAASVLVMSVAVVLSASLVYAVEHPVQPEAFASIPAAMWWAVCTLTTVGYGDVTPVTPLGKFLAAGIQLVAIAMVALPTSLFASGFAHIMSHAEQALEEEARDAAADGVITEDEAEAYAALAHELYVDHEIADEIIAAAVRRQHDADLDGCPHCGKPIG